MFEDLDRPVMFSFDKTGFGKIRISNSFLPFGKIPGMFLPRLPKLPRYWLGESKQTG